jgi:hypothetical protein
MRSCAFFFGAEVLHQAAGFEHLLDDAAQVQALRLLAQHVDHGDKAPRLAPALPGTRSRVVQRAAGGAGGVLQHLRCCARQCRAAES